MIFDSRIANALTFATKAHAGQVRKHTGEPYICHPVEVAKTVAKYTEDINTIIAAILHDTVEDNKDITFEMITDTFGVDVSSIVYDLTDQYTKEKYPEFNRLYRKELELERQKKMTLQAKMIKMADIIDNVPSIVAHDKEFAKKYIPEKEKFLEEVKCEAAPELWEMANRVVGAARSLLEHDQSNKEFENLLSNRQDKKWREAVEFRKVNKEWLKLSADIALRVLDEMEKIGIKDNELAKRMDVPPQQVSDILKGRENLKLETITKLNNALGVKVIVILKEDEIVIKNQK